MKGNNSQVSEKKYLDESGLLRLIEKIKTVFAPISHNHNDVYYVKSEVDKKITENTTYHTWIVSNNGDVLTSSDSTTLTCQIVKADNYIDVDGKLYNYSWRRYIHGIIDTSWIYHGKSVTVSADNFSESITYVCEIMQLYNIYDNTAQLTDASNNELIDYYPCNTAEISLFKSVDEKLKAYATTSQLSDLSTGKGANGTWEIDIIGNAATADSAKTAEKATSADSATVANSARTADSVTWENVNGAPTSMPASDVSDWAKAKTKPSYSWSEIGSKPSVFTPDTHTHTKSQITDFPTSLPASDVYPWAKQETKPSYTYSEVGAAASTHDHNSVYYQKSEVDQKISDNSTYHTWITSSKGNMLTSSDSTTLTCYIMKAYGYVDPNGSIYSYSWRRYVHGSLDGSWCTHGKSVTVSANNFTESITYVCEIMQEYNILDPSGNQLTDTSGNTLTGYYPSLTAEIALFKSVNEKLNDYATTSSLNSSISTLNSNVSSLSSSVSTINSNITTINTNISNNSHNLITPKDYFAGKKILLLGDSYCINSNTSLNPGWSDGQGFGKIIASYYGMTLTNYAVSGSGFGDYNSSSNYLSQLNSAISAISDKDNYALVLFAGGANDGDQSSSTIDSRVQQCYTLAKANFKNAKIYAAFIGWSRNGGTFPYFNRARNYWSDACAISGMPMLHGTEWAIHHWDRVGTDNLHPNSTGQSYIAKYIISALNNGGSCTYKELFEEKNFTVMSNGASEFSIEPGFRCSINDGTCTIAFKRTYFKYNSAFSMKFDGGSMYQVANIHSFMGGGTVGNGGQSGGAYCPSWVAMASISVTGQSFNYTYMPIRLTILDGSLWMSALDGDGGATKTMTVNGFTLFPTSFTCSLDQC